MTNQGAQYHLYKKKLALIIASLGLLCAAGLVVMLSDSVNVVTALPKGYCKEKEITMTIGQQPEKVSVGGLTMNISLVDTAKESAAYFIEELTRPDEYMFMKISQVTEQDSRVWQEKVLIRTLDVQNDTVQTLVAYKCS